MKLKYRILLVVTLLIVLSLIGLIVYNMTQLKQLQQQQQQTAQSLLSLNDQFVALQRDDAPQALGASQQPSQLAFPQKNQSQLNNKNSQALLRAQLQLVQFALEQHETLYAYEQLQKIEQGLAALPLATALKRSLAQSFAADRLQLQQQSQREQQQQSQLLAALDLIDRQVQLLQRQPAPTPATATDPWWQSWFKLEAVQAPSTELTQRQQRYQTLQWRLQLAQQAHLQGQGLLYLQQMNYAQQLLVNLPDADSRAIALRLSRLQQQPSLAVVQLQSLALLQP